MSEKRTAAIVVGHGSIHSDSGKSMIRIAARLREQGIASIVEAGFLNYNAPTLADAVQKGLGQGAMHFVIQPYFLIDGHYASQDLPALVHTVAATVPTGTFTLGETLGYHAGLVKLVQKRVTAVDPGPYQESALLVVAHGTPLEAANAPIHRAAAKVGKALGYAQTVVAFLDCNAPAIPAAIAQLVTSGYRRLVVQPYFLHLGRHVRSDLPALFDRARGEYPEVELLVAHHLDYDPLLVDVAAERVLAAVSC